MINVLLWGCAVLALSLPSIHGFGHRFCNATDTDKVLGREFPLRYKGIYLPLLDCNITSVLNGVFNSSMLLDTIDLSSNKINHIDPGSFDPLTKLHELSFYNNKIEGKDLHPDVFRNIKSLNYLSLGGNNMTGAPGDLLKGSNLRWLELNNCSLYDVPAFVLDPTLTKLKHLKLASNHLQKLNDPNVFSPLQSLSKLDLSKNYIDYIHPDFCRANLKLEHIYLQNNKLGHLPESLFQNVPSLSVIDLRYNLITTVPANAFSGTPLRRLILTHNRIKNLPRNFCAQFSVGGEPDSRLGINFDDNPWQCACLKETLKELKESRVVRVKEERDLIDPDSFERMVWLNAMEKTEATPCVEPDDSVCHRE